MPDLAHNHAYEIAGLRAELASIRWQAETAGITFGGYLVATDRESQAKLTSRLVGAQAGLMPPPVRWKMLDGQFATLATQADFAAIALAVAGHVQKCFDAEQAVGTQIDTLPAMDRRDFDLQAAFDAALAQLSP